MRDLAVELQHAISRQHGPGRPACSVQWRRQLHPSMMPSKRSKLQQTNRQSYDLVVASYVLTEMQSDAERQQAVDMLWRQTKDVLVLLEPGTPSGSSYVRHARTQVQATHPRHAQMLRLAFPLHTTVMLSNPYAHHVCQQLGFRHHPLTNHIRTQ